MRLTLMRNIADLKSIHRYSSYHRERLAKSDRAGCFYCLTMFDPREITDWVDGQQPETGRAEDGVTAICPRCGIDAVLPAGGPFALDDQLLDEMHQHFFEE